MTDPTVAVIKHANPCGVAAHDDIVEAYRRAHACDPVSAFGGIVAVNREVPVELAEALADVFTEVIVAPSYTEAALAKLTEKKNIRVIEAPMPVVPAARHALDRRRPPGPDPRPGLARSRGVDGRDRTHPHRCRMG